VSFIRFLNAIPLGWGFLHGSHKGVFDVLFDVPSECARHLARGEADVGLIPVIEYQRIPGLKVLPGISIASKKQVKSVLFVSRMPIERVSRVALDTSSRTSVVLLKILLSEFFNTGSITFVERDPRPSDVLGNCDAALLIGPNAIKASLDGLRVYDLAQEWYRFTGLPFVFAFWAMRPKLDLGSYSQIFYESRREGLLAIPEISNLYAHPLGPRPAEIRTYLETNLDYSLDEENLEGLNRFFELSVKVGAIKSPTPLDFWRV
jgi:chorismate dehydratase